MKILLIGLIAAIVIIAFKTMGSVMTKIKVPGLNNGTVGQWFKNTTENLGWLLAVGGQAFCLILIWQCLPEFFERWIKTNGFWFIQLGLIVSFLLLKYAKPQLVGAVVLSLTMVFFLTSILSVMVTMAAEFRKTQQTPTIVSKQQKGYEPKSPVVIATPDKVSSSISIPFGKEFWVDPKGTVYCYKNGRPLLRDGERVILRPGDTGVHFGTDSQSLAFQSVGLSNVIVVVHLRDYSP